MDVFIITSGKLLSYVWTFFGMLQYSGKIIAMGVGKGGQNFEMKSVPIGKGAIQMQNTIIIIIIKGTTVA